GEEVTFRVQLSAPASGNITFDYATANGTAAAGEDYTAVSGSGQIDAGQTTFDIPVQTTDNEDYEGTRGFTLTISNAKMGETNLVITNATLSHNILDDEDPPADDPPPAGEGSPLAALEHPRMGFVPESEDYVFGRKLSTF